MPNANLAYNSAYNMRKFNEYLRTSFYNGKKAKQTHTIITFFKKGERKDLIIDNYQHQKVFCKHILSGKENFKIRFDTFLTITEKLSTNYNVKKGKPVSGREIEQ